MTTEQQRKMLEAAAKACGFKKWRVPTSGLFQVSNNENWNEAFAKWMDWNPLTNPADTAEMCAKLCISVLYEHDPCEFLACFAHNSHDPEIAHYKDHDNSRLKAWMYAATMIAAQIGGYKE